MLWIEGNRHPNPLFGHEYLPGLVPEISRPDIEDQAGLFQQFALSCGVHSLAGKSRTSRWSPGPIAFIAGRGAVEAGTATCVRPM